MTYNVFSGTLNPTHLTLHCLCPTHLLFDAVLNSLYVACAVDILFAELN